MHKFILIVAIVFCNLLGYSQVTSVAYVPVGPITTPFVITVPTSPPTVRYSVKSARLKLIFNTGTNFVEGSTPFSVTHNIKVVAKDASNNTINNFFSNPNISFAINESKPEQIFYKEFSSNLMTGINSVDHFDVTAPFAPTFLSGTAPLQIKAIIEIDYNYDVRSTAVGNPLLILQAVSPLASTINSRILSFNWTSINSGNSIPFQNYQFQLLKLENTDPTLITAPPSSNGVLETTIDWNKALTIETQTADQSLVLTMCEGTGYYVWRVRPIGNYFPGGIGNVNNWGQWSNDAIPVALQGSAVNYVTTSSMASGSPFFFYNEKDENINWIYERTFSEENKKKEGINYANGLKQIKQSQVYLPSRSYSVVKQTITDNSGRPSLNSLPVPVLAPLDGFRPDFMKDNSLASKPYTAKNFDESTNYNAPDKVTTSITDPFYYYTGNVIDGLIIPDAEGYTYSRTLFYNDGTGRVKEQSMAGKAHSIGTASGQGHTKRTMYSTPSDDELIKIFGDEAPKASQVLKTINIDENGTPSISYSSKGKVIATCLADVTAITREDDNLLSVSSPGINFTSVVDIVENNMPNSNSFSVIKRLAFVEPTAVTVKYNYNCNLFNGCVTGNCAYKLKITIRSLDDDADPLRNFSFFANINCTSSSAVQCTTFVDASNVAISNTQTLPKGNYIIEKTLTPDMVNTTATSASPSVYTPIQNLLNYMLSQVKTPADYDAFLLIFANTTNFNNYLASNSTAAGIFGSSAVTCIPADITSNPVTNEPEINIPSSCAGGQQCCNVKVNLKKPFSFTCPSTFSSAEFLYGQSPLRSMDFIGYLEAVCAERGISYTFPAGFPSSVTSKQTFNNMLENMLTEAYYTGERCPTNLTLKADCTTPICAADVKIQYNCEDLWKCWLNVINVFVESATLTSPDNCYNNNSGNNEPNGSKSNGQGEYNNLFTTGDGFLSNVVTMGVASLAQMKDQEEFDFDFFNQFLQCAGFKFAEILDMTTASTSMAAPSLVYQVNTTTCGSAIPSDGYCTTCTTEVSPTIFPNIYDVEHAFKYFVYIRPSAFPSNTNITSGEKNFCYFADSQGPPCTPVTCSKGHETWSSYKRMQFYEYLRSGTDYIPTTPPSSTPPTCDATFAAQLLSDKISECNSNVDKRKGEIKALVLALLKENCWDIDGCATSSSSISMEEIDNLVEAIITELKNKCASISTPVCTNGSCPVVNGSSTTTVGAIVYTFSECDMKLFGELSGGKINFNLNSVSSHCSPPPASGGGCTTPSSSCSTTPHSSLTVDVTQ